MARRKPSVHVRLPSLGSKARLRPRQSEERLPSARHRGRILQFQERWQHIREDLPPQFSRRHIGMIFIGGVIGTGLFLGSSDALYHGGPVGALLAYFVIGTVVYCLCVSIGEMISFLPNVGGVVGFADLYVDQALGFSLGWASWYSWTLTFPGEIAAAAAVVNFWDPSHVIPIPALLGTFLAVAVVVNCLPSRFYGEMEYWFSSLKVLTVVCLLIVGIVIDAGAGHQGKIGFKNWKQPFANAYLGIEGPKGRFLGFWTVIMQAFFSFSGSEMAGIAAGEVVDATRNVPRALRNVWIRITIFYLGGIFIAGLLVPQSDTGLQRYDGTANSSPFVIAIRLAGIKALPHIVNAVVLMAAWSAAAADLYISSRFLFFLSKRCHAPAFLANLVKYPSDKKAAADELDEEAGHNTYLDTLVEFPTARDAPLRPSSPWIDVFDISMPKRKPLYVLPLACVLTSASFGLLTFLSIRRGSSAQLVFRELCAATSAGSLLTWTAILLTYLRWYQGAIYAEKKHRPEMNHSPSSKTIIQQIETIKKQRHWAQPYCAIYGLFMCALIILTNGWSVFISYEWHIARAIHAPSPGPLPSFLASYVPIPCFVILTLGYKLIYRTRMVRLHEMSFTHDLATSEVKEERPKKGWKRFIGWIFFVE